MNPEIAYQKFLLKINKGNTEFNIQCDKARFALIINEVKNIWENDKLKNKDSILIDDIQSLVVTTSKINGTDKGDFIEFPIDSNFFECISVTCEAVKNKCKKVIFSRPSKGQNKNLLEFDENQKPDFDWEWTFHQIASNSIKVYKTDFTIPKITVTYYLNLPTFDIEGYINIDNTNSTNQPLPIDDRFMDEIINYAVEEFFRSSENSIGYQLADSRKVKQN
jgi:hypothetical protein